MKQIGIVLLLIAFPFAAQGVWFEIAPGTGASEPLSNGDNVMISNSGDFLPGYYYSDGYFRLYYLGTPSGEVRFTNHAFSISGGQITGEEPLNVGPYTWADEVDMHIFYIPVVPPQRNEYSDNTLLVTPQTAKVPALSAWALVILLAAVSMYLFRNR
ncbi:hypothetical protein JW979_10640 [bacterium]|nr:hypothetical protein [candidate division CSSED10-310 bacterium]